MNASSKADEIIFVDLYPGSGLFSVGHEKLVFPGVCLESMSSSLPFTKWILCEKDSEQASVLENRIKRFFPTRNVIVLHTPDGISMDELNSHTAVRAGNNVAVVCLIDPFSMNISLQVINKLAAMGFSLLIPFTFVLNKRMNCTYYVQEQADILKRFIGETHFTQLTRLESNLHFYRKLVRLYQNNMLVMGLNAAISIHKLQSKMMELPAYYVGFFSRQFSTQAIQKEVNASEHFQYELF